LFDIDGTLLLSNGAKTAFNRAFQKLYGRPGDWGNIVAHGRTDPEIFFDLAHSLLSEVPTHDTISEIITAYVNEYELLAPEEEMFRVLTGASELLYSLSQNSENIIGIETGNIEPAAKIKLARAKLTDYFTCGGFGSDSPQRKIIIETAITRAKRLEPDLSSVIVIGDAPQDIIAAKANGAAMIAVATGRTKLKELVELEPDFAVETLEDTGKLVKLILSL
jgi:phosphoglycolate phosphatase-like HAD superfamily hydrolase